MRGHRATTQMPAMTRKNAEMTNENGENAKRLPTGAAVGAAMVKAPTFTSNV